ncbi:hypothetical protein GIY23_05805 [Allosaccharopolyspora coralli]|uniref:Uncharacterized protein n=1 Tax=Allosaccharopolyspora coralli TaxID=2665642 RepID=A0A5Q3Q471_9PSEU|nr:hypothetical protein [Allosaccharopolyspora coralli]QGK69113.1 hypothetical protein GIY23_05805 [Allosaccharopolyspora coralli]
MTLAQSSTVGYDLLILSFVGGFAVATLIFWPLLHRAHQNRTRSAAASGRHHLRKPVRSGSTAVAKLGGADGETSADAAPAGAPDSATAPATATAASTDSSLADAGASASEASPESVDVPRQPTSSDRFREHHAAQFEHTRSRIARLRDELSENAH